MRLGSCIIEDDSDESRQLDSLTERIRQLKSIKKETSNFISTLFKVEERTKAKQKYKIDVQHIDNMLEHFNNKQF